MTRAYIERMEGAPNVGAGALVFEQPAHRAHAAARGAGAPPAGGADPRSKRRGGDGSPRETYMEIARRNLMRSMIVVIAAASVGIIATLAGATVASAQETGSSQAQSKVEVSLLGGVHAFNKNDTALSDNLLGVPAVASVAYRLTPTFAAEGELTWLIPIQRSVDVGAGPKQDRKAPNTLSYQVGVRGNLQVASWSPYLAAGAGAVTFLSNSDADRMPRLAKSQTMFALNFGGGGQVPVNDHWGVRADFRELVAFPGDKASGFSTSGSADPIWIERGTVGLDYRF